MEYIIVQAGGKGTRLGYLTKNKPKALLPVENLPMLFHLFRKYPDKRFIIIAAYQKEVLREYLFAFAQVKYLVVDAEGTGTCAGLRQALALIPEKQPFMLIWSDLILPEDFYLPKEYGDKVVRRPEHDYIGISTTFPCRWSYIDGEFVEKSSCENGVAGFFLFTDKSKLREVPASGELVRWMQQEGKRYRAISLAGTKEFGLLKEYQRLAQEKCRPFNRITVEGETLVKEAVDPQGAALAQRECLWYEKARQLLAISPEVRFRSCEKVQAQRQDTGLYRQINSQPRSEILPTVYGKNPLRMEYIKGKNLYECDVDREEKKRILRKIVSALSALHAAGEIPADSFSVKEAYFRKTMDRLSKIEDLVPFARDREITINGKKCRNVYFYKRELEQKLELLTCDTFCFLHGDCTFSNLMLRENGTPVLIDPRGYFGFTEFYGDIRYDWAKLYYSIVGNYDRFNLKEFRLDIGEEEVRLEIASNHWEDMEETFFALTGAEPWEIRLLHAVIWLSLTTYAWQDYDSVCGAFYNGLYYLEDVL
ncbi:MAG: NTP transferase domain-containing protein [Lachnospiraceae bacterium]|nr:NTP transferase domain-containing protein [Lachnospiraceae bacterium]